MREEEEREKRGSGRGTGAGTKERMLYGILLRDTIALLRRTKGSLALAPTQFHSKTPLTKSPPPSFVPAPVSVPLPDPSSSSSSSPPPSLPAPIQPPKPSFSFASSLQKLFPEMKHLPTPPSDASAKENASFWKRWKIDADVILLSFNETPEVIDYLKNLAKAIHTRLKKTKILGGNAYEKEEAWDALFRVNVFDLVLITEESLDKLEHLKNLVQDPLFQSQTTIFVLSPSIREDKASLWKKICQQLKK